MPGIPSEDACFFGGTPRNYALTKYMLPIMTRFLPALGMIFFHFLSLFPKVN